MDAAHFSGDSHALATGIILGALMKANEGVDPSSLSVQDVRPYYDAAGNYTNQIQVRIGNKHYTVTVEDAVAEAVDRNE